MSSSRLNDDGGREPRADGDWRERANRAMSRYADGDDGAFEELYDLLGPRLHAFLRRRACHPAHAEDLLHETFLRMHAHRAQFREGAAVTAWAFAIARRLLIDDYRKKVFDGDMLAVIDRPDVQLTLYRLTCRLREELERLPASQREAFELVRLDGLSISEAAEVLGTTESAIKMRTHRTYEALRASLGGLVREELRGLG